MVKLAYKNDDIFPFPWIAREREAWYYMYKSWALFIPIVTDANIVGFGTLGPTFERALITF